jgi:sugar lactone lactonase YvrE
VAVDASSNVFVSDFGNNRIRKVDAFGNVTTLAGNGEAGFLDISDGGAANSELDHPAGIAVDTLGNLYFADVGNNRIRKLDPHGNVATVAGSGDAGYADALDGGPLSAQFDRPEGLAIDAIGNLYVGDFSNNRVRKIGVDGRVTTLAGNGNPGFVDGKGGPKGTAEFNGPSGVAVDSQGNVYAADTENQRIRMIDPGGKVSTPAGDGYVVGPFHGITDGTTGAPPPCYGSKLLNCNLNQGGYGVGPGGAKGSAEFNNPWGVAVDHQARIYVGDTQNNSIRKISR